MHNGGGDDDHRSPHAAGFRAEEAPPAGADGDQDPSEAGRAPHRQPIVATQLSPGRHGRRPLGHEQMTSERKIGMKGSAEETGMAPALI